MVADFLRDPQAHPLPDPPIQGLTMADPKPSDSEINETPSEFEFDDDELDADGNYIGSEVARSQQEAADDD